MPHYNQKSTLWSDIFSIVIHHLISVVTVVMGGVIGMLLFFGETRDALFIASVLVTNIVVGIAQEVRARLIIEKLSAVLARTVRRLKPNSDDFSIIPLDEMRIGDNLLI
ncbi:MAG: hypothetical protein WCI47_03450, partial [bacterium]